MTAGVGDDCGEDFADGNGDGFGEGEILGDDEGVATDSDML